MLSFKNYRPIEIGITLLIFSALIFFGCSKESPDNSIIEVDFSNRKIETFTEKTDSPVLPLNTAVSAMISPKETFTYYKQMIEFVSKNVYRRAVFKQRKTYKEINDLLRDGKIDFAFVCSGAYIDSYDESAVELLVIPIVNKKPYYYSYIITNASNSYTTFGDLQNKTFAFTDPLSNTGKLYPEYLITSQGYSVNEYLSDFIYTYAHDNSILAVQRNLVDGASIDGLIYEYLRMKDPESVKNVRVMLKSGPFGMPPVVVRKSLNVSLKNELRAVFLNMHKDKEGKKILSHLLIDRFEPGKDQDYDSIREMRTFVKRHKRRNSHEEYQAKITN